MTCLHLYKKKNITAKEINNTMKLTVWTESNLTVYDSAFFLSCLTPKLFNALQQLNSELSIHESFSSL